jgi:hypothetical protein
MPNGFTSPGGFNNMKKASSTYSIPWSSSPFFDTVYRTPATQSAFAYVLLQNGNKQSNRIKNFNYAKSLYRNL